MGIDLPGSALACGSLKDLPIASVEELKLAEAYLVAQAEAIGEVLSFDRSIDGIKTVTRREP